MTTSIAQFNCDNNILTTYFSGVGTMCNEDDILSKITQILEDLNVDVYIGVTHHPCQRFTGNMNKTSPLPESLSHLNYKFEFSELLTEVAHNIEYDKMYLICYVEKKDEAFQLEKTAIKMAKEIDLTRVKNKYEGGNGNLTKSEIYWLYVCTKEKLI